MDVKHTCPFGHKCESAIDSNTIERCTFYIQLKGKHPQTEEIIDQYGCAIGWLPILLIENAQTTRSASAAIESFRNETVQGQANFNSLLAAAMQRKISNG